MTRWAFLPILWAALLLPSSSIGWFDGLPLDTGPELIGLLLLLPLTVSRALRRHWRRARRVSAQPMFARWGWSGHWCGVAGAWDRAAPAALVALGLLAVGGKLVLLTAGPHEGFLGCYRYALAPPPTGPCERSFANPWFRHGVTRIDRAIDFGPATWNLGFLNSSRFDFSGLKSADRPLRQRMPLAATWRGLVARPAPWMARVTYVGEVTLRLSREGAPEDAAETRLRPHYGEPIAATVPIPAGSHVLELAYRFDDGIRWPASRPLSPWATLRFEEGRGAEGRGAGPPAVTARPAALWRALAAAVDSAAVVLGATMVLGYAVVVRRDWWLIVLIAAAGAIVARVHPEVVGLPSAFAVFFALVGLAFALLGRPWRRRLVVAFFGVAYLNVCLALSWGAPLDAVVYRLPSDSLFYESHARTILDTWSLEGGEPFFRFQPGFRYWRFLERLALGEGDPLVAIAALTLLAWGFLWAIGRLWPRPPPPWPRAVAFALAAGLVLALATSPPVLWFVQAPLSEYPTWILLPLSVTLLFASRSPRGWVWGGMLGGVAFLCRLNHVPAFLGYLVVFARRRWRESPRAVALTVALVLAMLTLPPIHNRYYGGPDLEAWRVASVNRAGLAIAPSRLAQLYRDPALRGELREQLWRVLYRHETREAPPLREPFSRLVMWGLQCLWVGTAIVALFQRRLVAGTKALLLVPLLYFAVQLLYGVEVYYPRHIVAGHLALGVTVLYAAGRGWMGPRGPARRRGRVLSPPA